MFVCALIYGYADDSLSPRDTDTEKKDDNNDNNRYDDYEEDDDGEGDNISMKGSDKSSRFGFHNTSRSAIQFLISIWPKALYIQNNFQAIPVDTVLDNIIPTRTKKKIVSVFGLYNDPPTARILLLAQYRYKLHVPFTRLKYVNALHDFNWMARKDALYASLIGERKYCLIRFIESSFECTLRYNKNYNIESHVSNHHTTSHSAVTRAGGGGKNKVSTVSHKSKINNSSSSSSLSSIPISIHVNNIGKELDDLSLSRLTTVDIKIITKHNILAKLREAGFDVVVRYIVSMI